MTTIDARPCILNFTMRMREAAALPPALIPPLNAILLFYEGKLSEQQRLFGQWEKPQNWETEREKSEWHGAEGGAGTPPPQPLHSLILLDPVTAYEILS